jgi:hypothetical protein
MREERVRLEAHVLRLSEIINRLKAIRGEIANMPLTEFREKMISTNATSICIMERMVAMAKKELSGFTPRD